MTNDAADDAGLGDWSKKREKMKTVPCLTNLSEDPQMNGRIIHFVDSVDNGETIFGRGDAVPKPDVILKGLNISKIQCVCNQNKNIKKSFEKKNKLDTLVVFVLIIVKRLLNYYLFF